MALTNDLLSCCAQSVARDLWNAAQRNQQWSQPFTTAFSILVAAAVSKELTAKPVIVYAAPHSGHTTGLLKKHIFSSKNWSEVRASRKGVRHFHSEWMVDITCVEPESKKKETPILAVESEACVNHDTKYTFAQTGYAWDFCKLVHFNCPRLLFVAAVNRSQSDRRSPSHRRLDELGESLEACRADYAGVLDNRSVGLILLPSTSRDAAFGRVGVSNGGRPFVFESLPSLWRGAEGA